MRRVPSLFARRLRTVALALFIAMFGATDTSAAAPAKPVALPDEVLTFKPITVSILEHMRVRGLLTVQFNLLVEDPKFREVVETRRPVLNNAYVRVLVDFGAGAASPDSPPDLEVLGRRLQHVTDSTLGRPGARVLLTQAHMRRLR